MLQQPLSRSGPATDRRTRRRLRSHRSPPRRSPRLLSLNNGDDGTTTGSTPSNPMKKQKTKNPSLQNHPTSSTPEETPSTCLPKCPNEVSRSPATPRAAYPSGLALRRSPRLEAIEEMRNCVRGKGVGRREGKRRRADGRRSWSEEQQMALRRAYLTAKPSPHFWKKVSKMVPGKSAQECFDRIHSTLATPPQLQPRSKANKTNSSPVSFLILSGSGTVGFMEPNDSRRRSSKRPRSNKPKSCIERKTVRHILKKHCLVDQSQEADLFSVFETSPIGQTLDFPEINLPSITECLLNPPNFLHKCNERSSSANKKMLSRFKTRQANHESPEVLKQIKNIALHEKYIDRLHHRETRRASANTAKSFAAIENENNSVLKTGIVTTAKGALMSKAKDFISQLQHMQANSMGTQKTSDTTEDDDVDYDVCRNPTIRNDGRRTNLFGMDKRSIFLFTDGDREEFFLLPLVIRRKKDIHLSIPVGLLVRPS